MHSLFDFIDLIHDPEPRPAVLNMAVDEILLQSIKYPILRIYQWLRPSVSFGYFEPFDPVKYPDRDPVRRWTGGGVVLHGDDFTYSILVPKEASFMQLSTIESYQCIHERIALALNRVGVPVTMADEKHQKISQACFENPAQFDVLCQGFKIAGAAQRRSKFGLLHQGSIQKVLLPVGFGENLASLFSREVFERKIQPAEWDQAKVLAQTKYATDAWRLRF